MRCWPSLPIIAVLLSGCSSLSVIDMAPSGGGRLFTYTKKPYTVDLHNTPVPVSSGMGKIIRLKEPFSGYGVSAEFDSNAIGDIAHDNDLKEVYFADMEEISFLGIWKVHRLYVYGE